MRVDSSCPEKMVSLNTQEHDIGLMLGYRHQAMRIVGFRTHRIVVEKGQVDSHIAVGEGLAAVVCRLKWMISVVVAEWAVELSFLVEVEWALLRSRLLLLCPGTSSQYATETFLLRSFLHPKAMSPKLSYPQVNPFFCSAQSSPLRRS